MPPARSEEHFVMDGLFSTQPAPGYCEPTRAFDLFRALPPDAMVPVSNVARRGRIAVVEARDLHGGYAGYRFAVWRQANTEFSRTCPAALTRSATPSRTNLSASGRDIRRAHHS